ncbi:MAG: aquaporin, partial [Fimbriimonadaceae bacterium]|nr:aquaporin [Fimbriimonadaceae bacterium]
MTGIFPAGILPLGEERVKVGPAVAEFLGVFFLCLAATLAGHHLGGGPAALVGAALVSGVVIAAGIAAFAPTSGAHFNPAVSLSFLLLG